LVDSTKFASKSSQSAFGANEIAARRLRNNSYVRSILQPSDRASALTLFPAKKCHTKLSAAARKPPGNASRARCKIYIDCSTAVLLSYCLLRSKFRANNCFATLAADHIYTQRFRFKVQENRLAHFHIWCKYSNQKEQYFRAVENAFERQEYMITMLCFLSLVTNENGGN